MRTAQRAADIARAQVLAGTLDIVTALQTQTTLYSDQDTLAQVRLARFLALVSLYKALGGGWTHADVRAAGGTDLQRRAMTRARHAERSDQADASRR